MQLQKLSLTNFGPFHGEHSLDLDVSDSAPAVLIHGENMRGKTSLVNAIRWCLYGEILGRAGEPKPTYRLMSYDALDNDELYMAVSLEFIHDSKRYELSRHVQADFRPKHDSDLHETATLKRNGQFVPEKAIPETVGGILHPEIARFFLFDGEMLAQYEALVAEPDRSTLLLRDSIQRILGLPALQQAQMDIDELLGDANHRQTRAVGQKRKATKLGTQAEELESELNSVKDDVAKLSSLRREWEQNLDDVLDRRARFSTIEADAQEAEDLESQIRENDQERVKLLGEIRHLLAAAWFEPAAGRASALLSGADEEYRQALEAQLAERQLEWQIDQINQITRGAGCPVCGHYADVGQLQTIASQKDEKRAALGALRQRSAGKDDFGTIAQRVRELRSLSTHDNLPLIGEKEKHVRRLRLKSRQLRLTLDEVSDRLREHDRKEIRSTQEEYETVLGDLREIDVKLKDQESRRDALTTELRGLRQQISKLPEADPRIATETTIYEVLRDALAKTVDEFRDELRSIVEDHATQIFRQLTTEPEYDRLSINDRYGLHIVGPSDRVITERSAGAEQVVALALIGALNRAAVREGPIVMDTPFGRLDVGHRKNILEFVPTMGSQVFLLVQSGEVDSQRDLVHLGDKIGRQYRLVRDGSPTKSRIEGSA